MPSDGHVTARSSAYASARVSGRGGSPTWRWRIGTSPGRASFRLSRTDGSSVERKELVRLIQSMCARLLVHGAVRAAMELGVGQEAEAGARNARVRERASPHQMISYVWSATQTV